MNSNILFGNVVMEVCFSKIDISANKDRSVINVKEIPS